MSRYCWLLLALVQAAVGVPSSSAQVPSSATLTPSELFEKVSPCVVKIVAKDDDGRPIGTGSGFTISPKAEGVSSDELGRWIVTNHHVIEAAVSAPFDLSIRHPELPRDPDGNVVSVEKLVLFEKVAAEDKRNDLAILAGQGDAPYLTLGADRALPIGTRVFVISSPEGLKNTLSEGLISGFRERENGEQWIQITAPISPGSSGGPVLTTDGRIIGVVVASHEEGQNLNFAVPVRALRRLFDAKTEPRPIWKGVSIREEESDAFNSAWVKLRVQVCGAGSDDWFSSECKAKIGAKAESGDQLAQLLKAREDRRVGIPPARFASWAPSMRAMFCSAPDTLRRAIKEKPSDYEYLAYYFLGKLTGDPWTCCECALTTGASADEMRRICYDPAILLLKKCTQLNPKFSPSFASLAAVYLETRRFPEALVAAEFLVTLVPNCWEAYMLRGKALAELGRISAADEDFSTAARLRPNWFDLYDEAARAYAHNDDRKAVDAAAKGLALPLPTNEEELKTRQQQRLLLWYETGLCYERLSDLDNAVRAFEEAHRLSPGRVRPADIEERIARCRAGLPGDGKPGQWVMPK